MLLAMMILLLFVFTLLGMEIAWAIGIAALAFITFSQFTGDPTPFVLFSQQMTVGVDSFALLAIPMFVFAGELMTATGVTRRLIGFASALVGHKPGGLANVGVTSNFVMSGISGSALADAAATGSVLIPEMKKKGYPPAYSCAVIAAGATMGPVIPPSISYILLGAIVNLSVGQLFLAGVIPGVLMFIAMLITSGIVARRLGLPVEPRATGPERLAATWQGTLPLLAPVFIILTKVYGIATPTEAAAMAVLYVVFLGVFVYRTLTWRTFINAAGNAALISAIVMLTVATSQIFSWLAVQERLGDVLTAAMLFVSDNPIAILFMVNILLLMLGMFMEPLPVMLVLAPILFPLLGGMGIDPIQLGVIMVLNLMIGMVTPPIGLNLFVMSRIGDVGVIEIFKAGLPYIAVLFIVLLAVTYIPAITLTLPTLAFR
ncbi:MAG: TRAP transporter large permease subunit [Alphaproteobacteria bacterium]|jgi:tripartite ATP-independent transporter DctM subunit|nr:TRAP transporter large permease subunit [Alphaproteobacteria bacterium]